MGNYPVPLGPDSDYWISRGRWIPTTPWDSVWNGVAQWMGIHDDADLDWILPNRGSFSTCDLFTDKDLFVDGACQCVQDGTVQSTVCDDLTYAPTLSPTGSPSKSPTATPSASPTAVLPDNGFLVASILNDGTGATIDHENCANSWSVTTAVDGTTERYTCNERDPSLTTSITIIPNHGKLSIVKALRLYPADTCPGCDPLDFVLEGRADSNAPWIEIESGRFPGIAEGTVGRNPRDDGSVDPPTVALPIDDSTYESADPDLNSTEVLFPTNGAAYLDYRLSYDPRGGASMGYIRYGELEMPGMILAPEPSTSPTPSPTVPLPEGGEPVASVIAGGTVTDYGCGSGGHTKIRVVDGTTERYVCHWRTDAVKQGSETNYVVITPSHGRMSIVKGIRMYTGMFCSRLSPSPLPKPLECHC